MGGWITRWDLLRARGAVSLLVVWTMAPGCLSGGYVEHSPDLDGDGFFAGDGPGWDCHDDNADAYPGHPERCIDGLDNDCDGRADGAQLPVLDPFDDGGMDEAWTWMLGDPSDLEVDEWGLRVADTPLVVARDVDAQCWDRYRLTVGWSFDDDASFALELVLLAGGAWQTGEARPSDGYVYRWARDGAARTGYGTELTLHRRRGGEEVLLNRATWEMPLENYRYVPLVSATVRALPDEQRTELFFYWGSEQGLGRVMVNLDSSDDRLHSGGVSVGVHEQAGELLLTGAYVEAI